MKLNKLAQHWVAFCFAFLLGVLVGLPQLLAVDRLGDAFGGIHPTYNDDEIYYLARGQDVADGHAFVAQPYLWEGKERLPLQFWAPDFIVGNIAELFSVPVHAVFVAFDFVFPAVLFLFSYSIVFSLTKQRIVALSVASFLHFSVYFILFHRPLSPQFNFVFFLGFIWSLLYWESFPTKSRAVFVGITFGLLFHVYAYYWTYAVVFFLLFGFGILAAKMWKLFRQVVIAVGVGLLLAMPYFYQLVRSFNFEFYTETVRRVGMLETHMPSGVYIVALAGVYGLMLLVLACFRKVPLDSRTILVSAMVFAAPIVTNQHIITGGNLEFSSHYRWTATFVSVFGYVYLLYLSVLRFEFSKKQSILTLLSAILTTYALCVGFSTAYVQTYMREEEKELQRFGLVFTWLTNNTPVDSVVFSSLDISPLIPAYTSNNVFYAREANLHYLSDEEVRHRFVVSQYFEQDITENTLQLYERSIWGTYYINRWQHQEQSNKLRKFLGLEGAVLQRYPEEEFPGMLEKINVIKQKGFRDSIVPYRVDYIMWDKKEDPEWNVEERVNDIELVYSHDDIFVYRLNDDVQHGQQ